MQLPDIDKYTAAEITNVILGVRDVSDSYAALLQRIFSLGKQWQVMRHLSLYLL